MIFQLKRSSIFFTVFLFFAYAYLLFELFGGTNRLNNHSKPAVMGVLDLSEIAMSQNMLCRIEGETEFYWHQLLEPSDFVNEPSTYQARWIQIPSVWNGCMIDGVELNGMGFAT